MEETISILKSESSSNPSTAVREAKLWDCRQDVFEDNEEIVICKEKIKEYGEYKMIRRVFVKKPQAEAYSNVGWVIDGDVEACMLCATDFSFFNRRHHCAVCGGVMCGDCTKSQLLINEFPDYGPVRACDQCFCGQEEVSVVPHFMLIEGDEDEEEGGDMDDNHAILMASEGMNDLSPSPEAEPVSNSNTSISEPSTNTSQSDATVNTTETSSTDTTPDATTVFKVETKRQKPRAIGAYLMKKSPAIMKGWQKRYVVLKEGVLKYYASKEDYDADKVPKGEINIMMIPAQNIEESIMVAGAANNEIHIYIEGDKGSYKRSKAAKERLLILQAIDEKMALAWVTILTDWMRYLNFE